MNLVAVALRRPITVVVAVIAVMLGAWQALLRMPRDILPSLGIPVIYVAQPYGGLDPAQMEGYVAYYYEYHFLYISGIESVESRSIQGVTLLKLQFHPGTNMAQAMAETIAHVNRSRAFMPPGTVPPFVMRYDVGSVPVGNLVFSSETRTVGEIQDAALNRVRPIFATLPGVSAPPPFGGNQRTIVVKVDPEKLRGYHLTPDDVVAAISKTNTIAPSGNVRIGDLMPMVPTNAVVRNIKELADVPIREGQNPAVFVRDIGTVEDSTDVPSGYALINGQRTVYIPVTKRADASTLAVVGLVRANLKKFQEALPHDVTVSYQFDQSPTVTRAIDGLLVEMLLGAALIGLTVLLFLRDLRSALIVVLNIPLALAAAIIGLWQAGLSINLMTLGGLALAVGILVDESTMMIENIHTHLARGEPPARAALSAGHETATPRFLAMLCVLAVFLPSYFMVGAPRALFVPLSLAVGYAMIASYLLSNTLVPVLSAWLLERSATATATQDDSSRSETAPTFNRFRDSLTRLVRSRTLIVPLYFAACAVVIVALAPRLGNEIFPRVDSGLFQMRLRAPTGTRIERTEAITLQALELIKRESRDGVEVSLGFVGVQPAAYPVNTINLWTGGPEESVMMVQLKPHSGLRDEELKEQLRQRISEELPNVRVSFEPADLVNRVMSLGAPTPVLVAVAGPSLQVNREHATRIRDELRKIPSLRDLQFTQADDFPTVEVKIDRERAGLMGVTVTDIARSVVTATSSSRFVVPNYWADPRSGIAFQIQVQVPIEVMNSLEQVGNVPVKRGDTTETLLRNVATVQKGTAIGQYDRFNNQRVVTLTANLHGADLGSVAREVNAAIARAGATPRGVTVSLRGQIPPMQQTLAGLQNGLLLAIVIIFLLLAANYQSLRLPLIVLTIVPAIVAGVVIALWVTGTTMNVQSFMGAIMAFGIGTSNAILFVTFAEWFRQPSPPTPLPVGEGRRGEGLSAHEAAIEGARARLRAILMTSFAMIAGMAPMALALGEGGEQSAPLGRAVIGGLLASTAATLTALPCVFAMTMARAGRGTASMLDEG